jgi:hypothetical protein
MNNKISILDIAVFMLALIILAIWVGIEKLIERRELKELIEKNSTKNKKTI